MCVRCGKGDYVKCSRSPLYQLSRRPHNQQVLSEVLRRTSQFLVELVVAAVSYERISNGGFAPSIGPKLPLENSRDTKSANKPREVFLNLDDHLSIRGEGAGRNGRRCCVGSALHIL
ncbi:hypothetical protein PoB_001973400 [Plakobranchus ocellatus]|uniref:Uncharacterized protein n=1 Tax=Plakobranchus ocellatus TaxID=259542 RepID=A0AAV3ZFU1_9GAST|nr:hypothetical protein PoB_001973400 [Plakobranchus ocellatus]